MALTPYKSNQGLYARGATGVAILILALFASWRFSVLLDVQSTFEVLGMNVSYGIVGAGILFVLIAAVGAFITFGIQTGFESIDSVGRSSVDLLVDTQNELQKVSWPGPEELRRSTIVVLICILVLGSYLSMVDLLVLIVMKRIQVLPP
ncbi:MAG: preprotein translocase subunit SecE [Candidatus Brocadiia bacterium]